ncbi:tetratricopeptide repeat protein [Geomonas sp.]|uniref:tetratricopeptide repeat protein n=1 Tax=Geomonas sp. TaxID=2651584 RepID=UPI002B470F90|nr:tetratricopeptide repeat protein [Geomonas sp.]HJV34219.1 tetratricopeptide repeat protein [Geomonas sp.]
MKRIALALLAIPVFLTACQSGGGRDTIAQLRNLKVDIKEEAVQGGLDKAMDSYQRFLDETPESRLTPTAMRRLADLKLEKEYGFQSPVVATAGRSASPVLAAPERAETPKVAAAQPARAPQAGKVESDDDFEKRATQTSMAPSKGGQAAGADELEKAGARDAIAIYKKLLDKFPNYPGNDQVLYQMSRAYEELGQTEDAMVVMSRLVKEYPQSRYNDEVRFRRAEFYFTRKKYIEGEDAYKSIVATGPKSPFYELALYKLGWSFYKQELYDEALHRFIALLDHKVSRGYDFAQTKDDQERKRVDDTFRVISQSFSYLHGADSVVEYFDAHGKRSYEDLVYSNLGEFYFDKRRYTDAAAAYNSFAKRNPFHRVTPQFHMRVIDIEMAGGFPSIVIEAKKQFARNYGLKAEYWKHFDPKARPEVLGWLKTNVTDLAHHYHSLYQDPEHAKEKKENFQEAQHWYEEFLFSFPKDGESPAINYQLAELLLENHSFAQAALEYEKTAYSYPDHAKSSAAGYAAIYAYRERLKEAPAGEKEKVKRETVRSSLKFADTFPKHEKAAIVLGAAADDLYEMKDYKQSLAAASKLIQLFPAADQETRKSAWMVVGHSCYELQQYAQAESAYGKVLTLLPADDKLRAGFVDNLAASIYRQGEQAVALKNYRAAADHFLRVGKLAATSKIRPNAEFDAAAALIQLKDWKMAATVLTGFRELFPGHQLQPEATRKIAYVYKENGQLALAAGEYERVETEFKDEEVRRGALMLAADLHQQAGNKKKALAVYRRFVRYFPEPVEVNVEMRNKVVEIVKAENDQDAYLSELKDMVAVEAAAGKARTPRTRFLAGKGALVLAEKKYERFSEVRLVKPFEENLRKKKELMKAATGAFGSLVDYEVGEVTAAATFYLAEIYANFSKSLTESERPTDLDAQEKQEFELAIEEQAYPFEEKAIQIHEKNLELIGRGIYNPWIDKSLVRLAKFMPARYDKPEIAAEVVASLDSYAFEVEKPAPPKPVPAPAPAAPAAKPAATAPAASSAPAAPSTTSTQSKPSTSSTPVKAAVEQPATTQAKTTAVPRAKAPAVVPQPTGGNENGTDAKR